MNLERKKKEMYDQALRLNQERASKAQLRQREKEDTLKVCDVSRRQYGIVMG